MKKFSITTLLLIFTTICFSQTLSKEQQKKVNRLFKNKTELYFTFDIIDKSEIGVLTKIISIDNVKNGSVWAYANKEGFEKFLLLNYKYKVLINPSRQKKVKTKDFSSAKQMNLISSYPTYTGYEAMMMQFAADYPSICKLVNIGTLPSGRKLLMLKITDNINSKEDEPQFLYTSTMHGDETAGYIGMLNFIDYLLSNYGTNTRVTGLVNNIEIWINPLANPDGTYAAGNNTVNGATRFNANTIDLNRNYPDPQAGIHPDGNAWQPETQFFMAFADTMNLVTAANFHGGAEVVNYPWDTWSTATADENWWIRESAKYADTVFANSAPGYFTSVTSTGITNGFDWYQITGGRQDYMNYFQHCREVTLEISDIKLLPTSDFNNNWNYNYRSYLNYMEECLYGIRGIIKDACTSLPIEAKVYISGHDFDSSHVYSSLPVGNYHRPIHQGTYNVTFSAPGYISQTINGIVVTNGTASVVNVNLSPASLSADFSVGSSNNCNGIVSFNDLSGSANTWYWNFGDGANSTLQNPTHTYLSNGTYNVSLVAANCVGSDSVYKNNFITVTVTSLPLVQGDSAMSCGAQSLSLNATGSGTLNWYDAVNGGSLVNSGTIFNTPVLATTTTYYVENEVSSGIQYVGPANSTIGAGGFYTAGTYHYLKFTALNSFRLVSVLVNSNTVGNRLIELRNSAGVVIQSASVAIPVGQSRVTLNFNVPIGVDLQLGIAGNNSLYRNSTGGSYPYSIANNVSITGNSANNLSYYYYFYDWEINQFCTSSRVSVTGIINENSPSGISILNNDSETCQGELTYFSSIATNAGTNPTYQWYVNSIPAGIGSTFATSTLSNGDVVSCVLNSSNTCATNNPATSNILAVIVHPLPPTPVINQLGMQLNSNSSTGNQWYNVSTGIILGENGASYSPITSGSYYVIMTDAFGCASDTSNVIQYSTTTITSTNFENNFKIYPNPNNGLFVIELNELNSYNVALYNSLGQKVQEERISGNNMSQINCQALPEGLYFIMLSSAEQTIFQKMIIKKKSY